MRLGIGDLVCCDDEGAWYDNGVSSTAGAAPDTVYEPINPVTGQYYPTGTVVNTPAPSTSSPSWLTSLFSSLSQAGASLTKVYATRNAVPQLNPGESITQLANGTYQVTQNASGVATGAALGVTSGLNLGGISLPVLLAVGVGVVLVMGKK